jgi:transposase
MDKVHGRARASLETEACRAVFAPEWIDLASTLGLPPKACRPHMAQTKGNVERALHFS